MSGNMQGFSYTQTCPTPPGVAITFPGDAVWNPGGFVCQPEGTVAYAGIDGGSHPVFSGAPSNDALPIEAGWHIATALNNKVQVVRKSFGVAADAFDAPIQGGVCCHLSADPTPGGTARGFALFIDTTNNGHAVSLVQINNGFDHGPGSGGGTAYTLLAQATNAWTPGTFVALELTSYSDPLRLKGTYLKAKYNGILLSEIVYAGGNAFSSSEVGLQGYFGVASSNRVVIYYG